MDKKIRFILVIIAVLSIGGLFALLDYARWVRQGAEEEFFLPTEREEVNPLGIKIPEQIRYYTGTIQKKSKNFWIIRALAMDNFLSADQDFKVYITQDTILVKYKMPSIYLKPGQNPKDFLVGQGRTNLSDFNVGDRVTVYAKENIKGKSEFSASEIRAVEYGE